MIHPVSFIPASGNYARTLLHGRQQNYSQIILITDANTIKFCKPLLDNTNVNYNRHIDLGLLDENAKTWPTVERLMDKLMAEHVDRNAALVVLGGGLLSDLAGWTGSIYKRGLHLYYIPTTLLAMVDAALGGKNGINFKGVKNQIGSIRLPEEVIIDPRYLNTLPPEQYLSGFAEMLKHGLIADAAYFDEIIRAYKAGTLAEKIPHFIRRSVEIKMRVVQQDPREKGLRKILNFGHTIGHALESCLHRQGSPVTHGHAVALGMMAELHLSVRFAGMDHARARQIIRQLQQIYPPVALTPALIDCMLDKMKFDKKNTGAVPRFVLLRKPGDPVWDKKIPGPAIRESIESLSLP